MAAGTRDPLASRLRCAADGVQRAEGIADAGLRASCAGNQRHAAVVVQVEEAELGAVVEVRDEVPEVDAELAVVGGSTVKPRFTVWKLVMYEPPSGRKSTPRSEKEPKPRITLLPPSGAKSLVL